jgi:hypothetical protein
MTAAGAQATCVADRDVVGEFAITIRADSDQRPEPGIPSFLRDFTNVVLEANPGEVFVRRVRVA